MNKYIRMTILVITILTTGSFGEIAYGGDRLTNKGTTSAAFLEVGIGARSMGMGGAYVAVAKDANRD